MHGPAFAQWSATQLRTRWLYVLSRKNRVALVTGASPTGVVCGKPVSNPGVT